MSDVPHFLLVAKERFFFEGGVEGVLALFAEVEGGVGLVVEEIFTVGWERVAGDEKAMVLRHVGTEELEIGVIDFWEGLLELGAGDGFVTYEEGEAFFFGVCHGGRVLSFLFSL